MTPSGRRVARSPSAARRPREARRSPLVALLLTVAALAGGRSALASETQWWISDSPADYARAEARGVAVGADGSLTLGPRTTETPAESLGVIWAILPLPDGSVALGGDHGRIDRWTASGGVKPWVRLAAGQVLSLAADPSRRGGLVAGTAPEGDLWSVSVNGDTSRLARTGERYVWGLAPAGDGAWYAATGTRGRLLRVSAGRSRVVFDTDESNLVSLVSDGHGGVYAGGDSRGRVLHARADGRIRTLFDAPEDEVRALAVGGDGAVYAAALSASAVASDEKDDDEGPAPAKSPVSGGRAIVYRIVPDSSVVAWWTSPQPFVYALAPAPGVGGAVLAATGSRAGVYRLERANGATQWLAAPQAQVTALAVGAKGDVFAATSNPAALWRIGPGAAERGELLSAPLDARRIARFGRVLARGRGRIELSTRSGNTETPDTTWSEWVRVKDAGGGAGEEGGAVVSPPARLLQWKIELAGDSRVESVEASWREQNVPPRVEDVSVAPQGQSFREGDLLPRTEPITQTLPGGQKVEYSLPPPGSPRQLRDLPMWARGLRTVQWKGTDANGDPLRYTLAVRSEAGGAWIPLAEDLEAPAWTWDTGGLPDGRYRLRVTASDAPGNPVGEDRTDEAISEPFTVDNTPPTIATLETRNDARGVLVEGRAEDPGSGLSRIEVSVDDGDWRVVSPEDGLTGQRGESFRATVPAKAGAHAVSVRAVDRAGNSVIRASRPAGTTSGSR